MPYVMHFDTPALLDLVEDWVAEFVDNTNQGLPKGLTGGTAAVLWLAPRMFEDKAAGLMQRDTVIAVAFCAFVGDDARAAEQFMARVEDQVINKWDADRHFPGELATSSMPMDRSNDPSYIVPLGEEWRIRIYEFHMIQQQVRGYVAAP